MSLPSLRLWRFRLLSFCLLLTLGLYALTLYAGPTSPDVEPPLPPATPTPPPPTGLAALAARAPMRMGVFVNDFLLIQPNRSSETRQILNDFNAVTLSGFFGKLHPCPPRALVDYAAPTYNATIHRAAQQVERCRPYLDYRTNGAIDWETYEREIEWNWGYVEEAVRWSHERGVAVHFQTLFWDHPADSVLPEWLQRDTLQFDTLTDTAEIEALATAFVLVMENHADGVMRHVCESPELRESIYAYDVLNEVTNDDGLLRGWKYDGERNPHPYNWALVNEVAAQDKGYQGEVEAYYLYKAFQVTERALSTHCAGQVPRPDLLLNDKFPINRMWQDGADNPNSWAEGVYQAIVAINKMEAGLIDGVGIQAHLILQPTLKRPKNPVAEARPILEAFAAAGLTIHITELDVSLRQADYYSAFDAGEIARFFPQQATVYRDLAHACLYGDEGYKDFAPLCAGITTWGLYDRDSWLDCFHPLLFNEGLPHTPRPDNSFCPQAAPLVPAAIPPVVPTPTPWVAPRVPDTLVPKLAYYALYNELRTIP